MIRRVILSYVFIGAVVAGCSDSDTDKGTPAFPDDGCHYDESTQLHELGSWQVWISEATGHWWIRGAAGERVAESPGSCSDGSSGQAPMMRLGEGTPGVREGFGAFQIDLEDGRSQMAWNAVEASAETTVVEGSNDSVSLERSLGEGRLRLSFSLQGDSDLKLAMSAPGVEEKVAGEMAMACRPGEAFFGLGTQVTGMELRGRTYPLWTQEQGNGKNDDPAWPLENIKEAAYAPMGVWHSSKGYAAIVGHDGYHELDLCDEHSDVLRLRSYPDLPELVFVAGASPKERLSAITDYTGRLDVAPDWVFGPWNDAVSGPFRLWQVAEHLRDHDVPSSAIWSEDWIGGELTSTGFRLSYRWEWDPETYPDLPEDIEELQSRGFAFLAYFNPFVPQTVPRYDEAVEDGHLIEDEDGEVYLFRDPAFRDTSLVDLSTEATREWTKGYMVEAIEELNIDGWMADFAEWLPTDAQLGGGQSPWRFHNRYPLKWQEVNRRAFEAVHGDDVDGDWTFFARSGWASTEGGASGQAPTMWGGDQNTDWGRYDGMPSIVPIGAHAGMAGVAVYGSDIAGYSSLSGTNTDKELFLRWASIGVFHGLMRTHHGGDKCGNWMYDNDEETLAAYRRYAQIRVLLWPYLRQLRQEARERGWPLVRHPYLVEGVEPRLWEGEDYQFFLGDDLWVAPILEQGQTSRDVALPEGTWWPTFGEAPLVTGATAVQVEAEVSDIPVFSRGGTALGLLWEPVDSFYGADDPDVSDLGDVEDAYRVALYPDADGAVEDSPVGHIAVMATGLEDAPDWTMATVDDVPIDTCDEPLTAPCATAEALYIEAEEATIEVDGALIEVAGEHPARLRLGVAGQAWGEVATAPPITDLDAPFESYCDGLPEDQRPD